MRDVYRNPPPQFTPLGEWLIRTMLAALALLGSVAYAGQVTLPPSSRAANLCLALEADYPCVTTEIGHVHGITQFLVTDQPDLRMFGTLTVGGHTYATHLPMFGAISEAQVYDVVTDSATRWDGLIPPAATWPTFRKLAGVGGGVPVLRSAKPRIHQCMDATSSEMASVVPMRVQYSVMALWGGQ